MAVSSGETLLPLDLDGESRRKPWLAHEADATKLSDEMFVGLVKDREAVLYRMAFMYVRNEHDALAMVSETICKAYSSRNKLKDSALFHTWITRILINVCLNHIKRNKRVLVATEEFLDKQAGHHAELEHKERQILLSEAIFRLQPEYKMVLSFDDIRFFAPLAEEDEAPVLENSIAGPWAFDILIDERFAQVETVTYQAVDPVAASKHGIAVESVEIRPYTSRIELTIDYAKNDLADEANAHEADAPWFKHKLDFFHTEISVEAGGKTYDFRSSDILWEEGDVVRCWCELDSMYFGRTTADATLQITSPSMNGEVISIPLVRD